MLEQSDALEVRVLGPMQIRVGDGPVALGGAKQRTLLALLVLSAGDVVSVERIVDELWGEAPPAAVAQSVQMHVSRLRRALASSTNGSVLVTRPSGYRIDAESARIDARRFERLFASGQRSRRAGDTAGARAQLETALGLWHGEALVDVERGPVLASEAARLEELRLAAQLERIECDLELGRHAGVVAELEALGSRHPLQEHVTALWMRALYGCGRQADALEVYRETRRRLVDELGLEPTQQLQELQARILRHDGTLAPPPRAPSAASSHGGREPGARASPRRWVLALAGAAFVALAVMVLVLGLRGGERDLGHIDADAVGALDPATGRLVAQVQTGGRPVGLAATHGALWLADGDRGQLVRIEPRAVRAVDTVPIGSGTAAVAAGAGAVWAVSSDTRSVAQVNVTTNTVVRRVAVGNGADAVAVGAGDVWVANALDGTVSQIQPGAGRQLARIPVGALPTAISVGAGAVWVANQSDGTVTRIDPGKRAPVATVRVGNGPSAIAADTRGVWVANSLDGTVSRIDPRSNTVTDTVRVGGRPAAFALERDRVWVAASGDGTISRLDARTGQVARTYQVGAAPRALAMGDGRLWTAAEAAPDAHRGGTLVMAGLPLPGTGLDPARAYDDRTYAVLSVIADGLIGHRRVAGAGGAGLVPDLASALPAPTDGGLTYRFQLRPGLHYSTGAPVRASDVRASIERLHRLGAVTLDEGYPLGLRGQGACSRRRCDLSTGIETDDATGTVIFHLRRPNPDFLLNLAAPPYVVLPAATARHVLAGPELIGTGPYRVASASATQVTVERNPRFHAWSTEAQPDGFPDRIIWRITKPGDTAASRTVDIEMDPDPASIHSLRTSAPTRLRLTPYPQVDYVWLNTRVAPFDNPDARRAFAYAVDRRAAVRAFGPSDAYLAPSCQLLSPGLPGYDPYCPYAAHPGANSAAAARPDLERARRLVARSGTAGTPVTFWAFKRSPARSRNMLVHVLRRIGYRARFNARLGGDRYQNWTTDAAHRTQLGLGGWIANIPTASNVIPPLLSCAAAAHRGPYPHNQAQFCDHALDTLIDRAHALEATEPAAASRLWARIDHKLVLRAAIIPLFSERIVHVTSARLGNYQYNPSFGPLLSQAWVH